MNRVYQKPAIVAVSKTRATCFIPREDKPNTSPTVKTVIKKS